MQSLSLEKKQQWLKDKITKGMQDIVHGRYQIVSPEWFEDMIQKKKKKYEKA